MDQSSGIFEADCERGPGLEGCPDHVHPLEPQCDDGLIVSLFFRPLSLAEGPALRISRGVGGGLGALKFSVDVRGAADDARLAGLMQDGRNAGGCGESVWEVAAPTGADTGDKVCCRIEPHPRQASDEGRIRVMVEGRLRIGVDAVAPRLGGEKLYQLGAGCRAGNIEGLRLCQSDSFLSHGAAQMRRGLHELTDEAVRLGITQLVWCGKKAKEDEIDLGVDVGSSPQKQIAQSHEAASLVDDHRAAASDKQAGLDINLGLDLIRTQTGAGAGEMGNGSRIVTIGLVPPCRHN